MTMQRLEARIPAAQKERLTTAATIQGKTLTAFVIDAAQAAADETIERHRVIELSEEAMAQFLEVLANPPGPNEYLRAAAAEYREWVKNVERR